MKPIDVIVTKYQALDGSIYDTAAACELYEKKLSGEVRTCPDCRGTGKYNPTGDPKMFCEVFCNSCQGRGYQEKTVAWK